MQIHSTPKVSVLMPVFNGEKYIKAAIESVLNQSFTDYELIIVNDGSSDTTGEVIKSFTDERIKLFTNLENKGLSFSRNKCIELSSGNLLAVLDSDDIALPQRLEEQVIYLEKHPDIGMVGSWASIIDEEGNELRQLYKYPAPSEKIPIILFLNNYFTHSSVMIRRESLPDGYYSLDYKLCEDYELYIRISRLTKVINLNSVLIQYRIHKKNITNSGSDEAIIFFEKKILADQCKYVGLTLNNEEINNLWLLSKGLIGKDLIRLQQSELLCIRIINTNKIAKCYEHSDFAEYISSIWLNAVYKSKGYSFKYYLLFINSILNDFSNYGKKKKLKFFVKCLFKK